MAWILTSVTLYLYNDNLLYYKINFSLINFKYKWAHYDEMPFYFSHYQYATLT